MVFSVVVLYPKAREFLQYLLSCLSRPSCPQHFLRSQRVKGEILLSLLAIEANHLELFSVLAITFSGATAMDLTLIVCWPVWNLDFFPNMSFLLWEHQRDTLPVADCLLIAFLSNKPMGVLVCKLSPSSYGTSKYKDPGGLGFTSIFSLEPHGLNQPWILGIFSEITMS